MSEQKSPYSTGQDNQPLDKEGNLIGIGDILRGDRGTQYKVLSVDHLQGSGSCLLECLGPVEPGWERRSASRYDLRRFYTIETKAVHEYLPSHPDLVKQMISTLLERLPAEYPTANFSRENNGYRLMIDNTIIFQGASSEDAIKHTKNYVEARIEHPTLPVGVIYGIYD